MATKTVIKKLIDAIKENKSEDEINVCVDIIAENISDAVKQTPFYSLPIETISSIVRKSNFCEENDPVSVVKIITERTNKSHGKEAILLLNDFSTEKLPPLNIDDIISIVCQFESSDLLRTLGTLHEDEKQLLVRDYDWEINKLKSEIDERDQQIIELKKLLSHSPQTKLSPLYKVEYDESGEKRGIMYTEHSKGNVDLSASSIAAPDDSWMRLSDLFELKDGYSFQTKDEPNSSITASFKDNKTFTINKYMIRGNWGVIYQPRSWVLKGKVAKTNEWIEIDRHTNEEPFKEYEIRTFDVHNEEQFVAVQIVQTGPNSSNGNYFEISGFDVYGQVFE